MARSRQDNKEHFMSDISFSHPHGLSLDEARSKTEQIVADVKAEFPSLISGIDWNADKTKASLKGKGFTGDFLVNDSTMDIAIKLSMFARPFKAKVEDKIKTRITKYFG